MSTTESPAVSRGLLITLGVVLGLAVLAALWIFVVSPLFEDDPGAAQLDSPQVTEPAPEPEVTPTPEATPVPETFEVFTARDPFQQLVTPAVAGPAPADTGDSGDDSDSGEDTTDTPAPAVRVGETSVTLVDVVTGTDGVTRVIVEVNGTGHEAAEGETFAERFRVLDITGDCATFLFGDNRFTLCKGEVIRK